MLGLAERVKARAMQATACEIEAQRRAINLQESSAIMFDRVHETGKARNARQRADHARERLCERLRSRITLGKAKAAK